MTDAPQGRPATPVIPRPSAALALLRDQPDTAGGVEVFMVRRHVQSEFVPDVFVFPGGSVKVEDREAELAPGVCAPVEQGATALGSGLRVAALRECFEEAGVLLARRGGADLAIGLEDVARFASYRDGLQQKRATMGDVVRREGLTLATDELVPWAHWITPEGMPKRFNTHFFLAAMPAGQQASHDELEVTDSAWVTPEEALRGFEAGVFPLVFATIEQLRALTSLASTQAARERFSGVTPQTFAPRIITRDGKPTIVLTDDHTE